MANELSKMLAGTSNTQTSLKRSTVTKSTAQNKIQIASAEVNVIELPEIRETKGLGGDIAIYGHATLGIYGTSKYGLPTGMIWGNTTYGVWGSALWGPLTTGFVLGSSIVGILGTNKLGSGNILEYAVSQIVNPNKIWYWLMSSLENDYWEHTDSTATLTAGTSIGFVGVQTFQTTKLSTESSNITSATLSIESDNITTVTNLTFYLSADNGANWEEVTNGTGHTFTNTGTNLRIKIVSSGNASIALKDSDNIRIPVKLQYE